MLCGCEDVLSRLVNEMKYPCTHPPLVAQSTICEKISANNKKEARTVLEKVSRVITDSQEVHKLSQEIKT